MSKNVNTKAVKADTTNKAMRAIIANAEQAGNGKLTKPLKKEDFDSGEKFAEYKLLTDNLQEYLYRTNTSGKNAKKTEQESKTIYIAAILNTLGATADQKKTVIEKLIITNMVNAGDNRRVMTSESKAQLKKLTDKLKTVEDKPITEAYTEAQKIEDIALAKHDIQYFKENKAVYYTEAYKQVNASKFRQYLELNIGYILIDSSMASEFQDSKKRANTKEWLRWLEKAATLDVEVETFKETVDIDGLKTAVKAAYKAREESIIQKALEQAATETK